MKLSVALATFNEEKNIGPCLKAVKDIADEIIVVDGGSKDRTVEIAKEYGAKVTVTDNPPIFHINKQKAIDQAKGEWILQMDADEIVSRELAKEIMSLVSMSNEEIEKYQSELKKRDLFLRHQKLVEARSGSIGDINGPFNAFFIPRRNYYLGRYLLHGGVYPDGVIRLIRKGKAYLPCKDVHEQFAVTGRVGWLQHDLIHMDSPTFEKYLMRWHRYTRLMAKELKEKKVGYNPFVALNYLMVKPVWWFLLTFIRHKGFLDSWQGFVFSFFSSLRFPTTYIKYLFYLD